MRSESARTKLIAELASLLRDCQLPDEARCAGLTLIGWLARRMPGETASRDGVEQAEQQFFAICTRLAALRSLEGGTADARVEEVLQLQSEVQVHFDRRSRPRRAKKQAAL